MPDALIVFAKLPRPGKVKTRLGSEIGYDRAAQIYEQLADATFSLADLMREEGKQVYLFGVPGPAPEEIRNWVGRPFLYREQSGSDLGDRMRDAFRHVFEEGAKKAVIIGTDIPELDVAILHTAYTSLDSADIVVGPSLDGGYYLLGMHAPLKDVFDGIAWSTGEVMDMTRSRVRELHLTFRELQKLSDVDTKDDYDRYVLRKAGPRNPDRDTSSGEH